MYCFVGEIGEVSGRPVDALSRDRARRVSNVLWIVGAALLVGSALAASLTSAFWDNYGALIAIPIGFTSMAAVFARQTEPERPVDLVFGVAVGIAAGAVGFFAVLLCSLSFADIG
jgi:hypothetical protein